MRKATEVLAGVFCAGALLCGIGCGVAFAELSSFEYVGEQAAWNENVTEHVIELDVGPYLKADSVHVIDIDDLIYSFDAPGPEPVYRKELDDSLVRVTLVYDEACFPQGGEPSIQCCLDGGELMLYLMCDNTTSDLQFFLQNKDRILQDLKERKIGSYRFDGVPCVVGVEISPTLEPYVVYNY